MQNTNDFDRDVQLSLQLIGGEPLVGSGFEAEQPESEFASGEEE